MADDDRPGSGPTSTPASSLNPPSSPRPSPSYIPAPDEIVQHADEHDSEPTDDESDRSTYYDADRAADLELRVAIQSDTGTYHLLNPETGGEGTAMSVCNVVELPLEQTEPISDSTRIISCQNCIRIFESWLSES